MSCTNENQLNPTFGNVVFIHITMTRYSAPFPVDLANDVEVNLISRIGTRLPQEKVTINNDSTLDVEIDSVPSVGVYGVEVKGSYGGYAWRTFAPCCLNYTYPTIEGGTSATVTGDEYDLSMTVEMNAPNAAQEAAIQAHNEDPTSHPYILGLISDTNANFANYYQKNQTYSQSEIDAMLQAINQFTYQVVESLPQPPSAATMNKIYLVPYLESGTNIMREYITIPINATYQWETIGDTSIALQNYSTTEQMNAAISSALASYYTKTESNLLLGNKANKSDIAGYTAGTTVRVTGASGVVVEGNNGVSGTNYSSVSVTSAGVSFLGQTLKWNNANVATQAYVTAAFEGAVNNGGYNSTTHNIELKNGSTVLATIDATPFIKDGMVSSVTVEDGNLVISFNTEAGQEDITLPISDIFDASDYYTKSEVYTKAETATAISAAMTNVVYVGANQGTVPSVDFDPETDTVHVTAQTLFAAQQQQARANIGAAGVNDIVGYQIVNHGTSDKGTSQSPYSVAPNKLHVWGEVDALYLTLATGEVGYVQEYMIQFESGATATTLDLPSTIQWINNVTPSDVQANYLYQISILNGVGVIGGVDLSSSSSS